MNFAALVVLTAMTKESWADAAEKQDDTLPPLPVAWLKDNNTVKVWQEREWTPVEKKRKVNNKPLGVRRR